MYFLLPRIRIGFLNGNENVGNFNEFKTSLIFLQVFYIAFCVGSATDVWHVGFEVRTNHRANFQFRMPVAIGRIPADAD